MPNYASGKIYVVRNTVNEKLYVGSTTQPLCARMSGHRKDAKRYPNYKLYTSMNKLGVENFYIELLIACPCATKEELLRAEGTKIRELDTVTNGYNGLVAGRTQKEHYLENRADKLDKARLYREANTEAVKDSQKNYRELEGNREVAAERTRMYREANVDAVREANRKYRLDHKDKIHAQQKAYRDKKKAASAAAAAAANIQA